LVKNPKTLTLADLKNEEIFPRQSNLVTIQCSGTRRIEQISEYAGEGDDMINAPWAEGAIGTARWTGVSLKKVIKHCGGLIEGAKHLEFYGAETYFKHVSTYSCSHWRGTNCDCRTKSKTTLYLFHGQRSGLTKSSWRGK
jgi:sulfite oxidase